MIIDAQINVLFILCIITTIITCLIKFYQGIWLIHKSIDKQNEILEEQNEILLKFLEEQKK